MKLLRLPSGQFFNVESIVNTDKEIQTNAQGPEYDFFTVYVYAVHPERGNGVMFQGSDARALYEWLVANSTAIGEDGREVDTQSKALKSASLIGQFKPGMLVRTTRNIIGSDVGSRLEPDKVIISQDTQGEIQRVDKYDTEGLPLMVEFEDRGRHWAPLDALEIVKQSDEGN